MVQEPNGLTRAHSARPTGTKVSVVIPVFNGSKTVGPLVAALRKELTPEFDTEVVLVNDGSPSDDSADVCARLATRDASVRFVDLSRSFGEHNAVMAGLRYCSGDVAVIMDDDFQNPPSEVAALVRKLNEGYDVVFARYERKMHGRLRNLGSWFNNVLASAMIGKPLSLYLASFKAINRFVVDNVLCYTGPYPYVDGLILRITRRYATVTVAHSPRREGRSNYTLRKLVRLWLNMFTNFSVLPLRVSTILGLSSALAGFVLGVDFAVDKIRNPGLQAGWTSLIVSVFLLSGVQLVAIGMIGEYLGRLFMRNNGLPQYVVRSTMNCIDDGARRH
jgi:undecaprenyl-phosphate 4-deoxy-4-formamido-L-arabinose transferase